MVDPEQTDNQQFSDTARARWSKCADWYSQFERYELPAIITCAELTDIPLKGGAVLEVACGPGLHSETLAKSFLHGNGSVLVSCDFS